MNDADVDRLFKQGQANGADVPAKDVLRLGQEMGASGSYRLVYTGPENAVWAVKDGVAVAVGAR